MRSLLVVLLAASVAATSASLAGEAEIRAAQGTIESQFKAFLADDGALAYFWAAPGIKQAFPDVGIFMGMVESGYMPVRRPRHWAFGEAVETSASSVVQQVLIVGPDGKDYEAVYTLELQPDGVWRITGVSLRQARSLGA